MRRDAMATVMGLGEVEGEYYKTDIDFVDGVYIHAAPAAFVSTDIVFLHGPRFTRIGFARIGFTRLEMFETFLGRVLSCFIHLMNTIVIHRRVEEF